MILTDVKTLGLIRTSLLTLIVIFIVSSLLQTDIPTLQGLRENVTSTWIEGRLEMNNGGGEQLLRDGWTYYNLGQYDKAKALMEKSLEYDNNISALYCLGMIDLKYHRYDQGIEKLEQVNSRSPKHLPTLMELGRTYFQQRYYKKSKNLFEKAVNNEPTNAGARLWLGKTYIQLNDTDNAREVLGTVTSGQEAAEAALLIKNL